MCRCLLSRSLLGVKRTCVAALHESAFDPKQTFVLRCHRRENLKRYRNLLTTTSDESVRSQLLKLIADEERRRFFENIVELQVDANSTTELASVPSGRFGRVPVTLCHHTVIRSRTDSVFHTEMSAHADQ